MLFSIKYDKTSDFMTDCLISEYTRNVKLRHYTFGHSSYIKIAVPNVLWPLNSWILWDPEITTFKFKQKIWM